MKHEKEIKRLLWSMGVNLKYLGFAQAAYGLELSMMNIKRLKYNTKSIYLDIAKKFNTSHTDVERNIRTLVEAIWDYGNRELLQMYSRNRLKKKPTNTEFLMILTEYFMNEI